MKLFINKKLLLILLKNNEIINAIKIRTTPINFARSKRNRVFFFAALIFVNIGLEGIKY